MEFCLEVRSSPAARMSRDGLPFDIKPSKVVRLILASPPPMPKCFTYLRQWQDYLMVLHTSGERITRRRDLGKYRGEREVEVVFVADIDHCGDCHHRHKAAMERAGRCFPSAAELARELEPVENITADHEGD